MELPLAGLTCQNCVQAVERALLGVSGVRSATVNLGGGRAFVEYDATQTSTFALHDAIKAAGYRSEGATARFRIDGITCASCATRIETALRQTPGVLSADVNVGTEEAVVEYLPSVADLAAVRAAVGAAGYKIIEAARSKEARPELIGGTRGMTARGSHADGRPGAAATASSAPADDERRHDGPGDDARDDVPDDGCHGHANDGDGWFL